MKHSVMCVLLTCDLNSLKSRVKRYLYLSKQLSYMLFILVFLYMLLHVTLFLAVAILYLFLSISLTIFVLMTRSFCYFHLQNEFCMDYIIIIDEIQYKFEQF